MKKSNSTQGLLPYLYIFAGLISFFSSFIISVEKNKLLLDPTYIPPCSINPVIGCGAIMKSWQAAVFGFPNPWLGIIGFSIVVTIGFALLAGAEFKRWFWLGIQAGLLFAVGFVYWLFYQAVYHINSLCLYCMVVWAMTIPLFLYTLVYNLKEGHFTFINKEGSFARFVGRFSFGILILMYLVILLAILIRFWDQWLAMF